MTIALARARAEQLVASLSISEPPIDVIRIAKALGLRVVEAELGADASGLLVTQPGDVCIVVHERDHKHLKRFTIAHEIGHFVLRHQFENGGRVHVDRGTIVSYRGPRAGMGVDPKEIEANQFAASLLMPTALLRRRAPSRALSDRDVEELARVFDVSEQAMTIRLTRLKMI